MTTHAHLAPLHEGHVFVRDDRRRPRVGEEGAGAGLEEGLPLRGGQKAAEVCHVLLVTRDPLV